MPDFRNGCHRLVWISKNGSSSSIRRNRLSRRFGAVFWPLFWAHLRESFALALIGGGRLSGLRLFSTALPATKIRRVHSRMSRCGSRRSRSWMARSAKPIKPDIDLVGAQTFQSAQHHRTSFRVPEGTGAQRHKYCSRFISRIMPIRWCLPIEVTVSVPGELLRVPQATMDR